MGDIDWAGLSDNAVKLSLMKWNEEKWTSIHTVYCKDINQQQCRNDLEQVY